MSDPRPIGIFDSGLGGLTVAKEIYNLLPHENTIYIGDTARVPYGNRSPETVTQFTIESIEALLKFKVKTVVIACGTASSVALKYVQQKYPNLLILGVIDPAAQDAVHTTSSNHIGVIGTNATIGSNSFTNAIRRYNRNITVHSQSCPLFVPLVEEGIINHEIILKETVKYYLTHLKSTPIDTLILGCTHYPIIGHVISAFLPSVKLVNTGASLATNLQSTLHQHQILNSTNAPGVHRYFVTDKHSAFEATAHTFLNEKITIQKIEL